MQGNYINTNGALFGPGTATSCDVSCTNPGIFCNQDSDCGTCTSAQKCIPEPVGGFAGSPTAYNVTTHNAWMGNHLFDGFAAVRQCTVAGNIGQQCNVAAANGTCAGGAPTCTGTPAVCGGTTTESGKLCCNQAGTATCGVRTPTPFIRHIEYPAGMGATPRHAVDGDREYVLRGGDAD